MLDLTRLNSIQLNPRPLAQRVVATAILMPNYNFPGRSTKIVLEGLENLPASGGCVFVMNHTDRYNYWPFQYKLWREGKGFTATWVKGKYYENPFVAWFMDVCNNIPIPSKGYVLSKDFQTLHRGLPTDAEYCVLKGLADGKTTVEVARTQGGARIAALLDRNWEDSPDGAYLGSLNARFAAQMTRVVEINRDALKKGLHLLIFPQGTRSVRLTPGHTGAAQMILHTGAPVIPVGCNGSEKCYPGNSPLSRGGKIVYRIGKPLRPDVELAEFRINKRFVPFTESADEHQDIFRKMTDLMMMRINALLDPEYRFQEEALETKGAKRFL